ncbi:nSTAND3 domain-containing NTPase [Undibacterium danionis]|uniref:Novel STAND NTPase 3 domain-containing protein n=1 Tax=Undibacterium danionis TaxID=1812100 RepID=A0ABV6IDF6_9BURK
MPTNSLASAKPDHLSGDAAVGGSGAYSILGYEYQIDVSVWLALDLVLAAKLAQEVVLEPATEEDVEADLEEHEPGRVTTEISLGTYRLIVQAKCRSGDAWTVAGIQKLLKHGKVRKSAAKRLEESSARYLLVTSAGLNGGTRHLRVRRAGIWPKSESMPASIKHDLPEGATGRVAVIGNQDEERLETDIKRLLTESFRIPHTGLKECQRALREEARLRIAGAGAGHWTRSELEQLIRRHGGYIASSPELDQYVYPTNWPELLAAIRDRHAALITGQSGTGKTMATRKLFEELREQIPGLTRVPITLGPQQLISDTTESPVLYDIEDPWGRYDFEPAARPWNEQLSQFFSQARHDRFIVATSRLDVAQATGALGTVKPWIVGLEAEHYGKSERKRLYQTRIDALPRRLHGIARRSEVRVLSELATPLEIQKFFDALPTIENSERHNSTALIVEAIRRAHQNSIERTVVDQIEARNGVSAAAIIWGLLKTNEKLSINLLRQIEEELFEKSDRYGQSTSQLLSFFVAARNLRQVESTITYYHPRVEAGIEKALLQKHLVAKRSILDLIEILMSSNNTEGTWGIAASARLLRATDRTPELRPKISSENQKKIDSWIAIELAKGGRALETNLELAASVGSSQSDVSEVARFLLHRQDNRFGYMHIWRPLHQDETWYANMRANPAVKALLQEFIVEVLPDSRDYFFIDFVSELRRLALGLTPAFLAAAEKMIRYGVASTTDVIAEGALDDIEGFERIINVAIEVRTPSQAELLENAKTQLAILNEEYSNDYIEHISDNDDGWTAGEFIDAYVKRVRKTISWKRIAEHKHSNKLVFYWLRAMANAEQIGADEIAGAFTSAFDTEDEDNLWPLLTKTWDPLFSQKLKERILDGHTNQFVRHGALLCMAKNEPELITQISKLLFEKRRIGRLIELAIDLSELQQLPNQKFDAVIEASEVSDILNSALPVFKEIYLASVALLTSVLPTLSQLGIELLKSENEVSETVRVFRLNLDQHVSVFMAEDIHWLLAYSAAPDSAVVAIKAAIRHGLSNAIEVGLSNRFASVVALALNAIATPMVAPLPSRILNFVSVKGRPVRQALVELINSKPHSNHLATLLILAHDKWSPSMSHYGESVSYPIAAASVVAISKLSPLDSDISDKLYHLAIDTSDSDLRYAIFELLMQSKEVKHQTKLFELATSPGKLSFRLSAVHALLAEYERVAPETLAQITPQLLNKLAVVIASRLLLLLAVKGNDEDLLDVTRALAANNKQRVLLLLVIWGVQERSMHIATQVASFLPLRHPAVSWALGGAKEKLDEKLLDDLGDPQNVEQVLLFMQPSIK